MEDTYEWISKTHFSCRFSSFFRLTAPDRICENLVIYHSLWMHSTWDHIALNLLTSFTETPAYTQQGIQLIYHEHNRATALQIFSLIVLSILNWLLNRPTSHTLMPASSINSLFLRHSCFRKHSFALQITMKHYLQWITPSQSHSLTHQIWWAQVRSTSIDQGKFIRVSSFLLFQAVHWFQEVHSFLDCHFLCVCCVTLAELTLFVE